MLTPNVIPTEQSDEGSLTTVYEISHVLLVRYRSSKTSFGS